MGDVFFVDNDSWRHKHDDQDKVDWNNDSRENSKGLDRQKRTENVGEESYRGCARCDSHRSGRASESICHSLLFRALEHLVTEIGTSLPSIDEHEDVVSSDTQYHIDGNNLETTNVGYSADTFGDANRDRETEEDNGGSDETQKFGLHVEDEIEEYKAD